MTPLLLVLPLTPATLPAAATLLSRIAEFDAHRSHTILLVASASLTKDAISPIARQAESIFGHGEFISTPFALPDESHPYGYNWLFETAAKHISATLRTSWLWLDPRCVPMRRGWLNLLEEEYARSARPFLGQILTPAAYGTPFPLLSAVSIYPGALPRAILQRLIAKRSVEWETSCAEVTVQLAHPSKLIYTVPSRGTPTIFARGSIPGTVDINSIPSTAVLVHTSAQRSLLAALRDDPQPGIATITTPSVAPPAIPRSTHAFYHSGNLGDIIYALYAIKLSGGGALHIGPQQRHTPPPRTRIKQSTYDQLAPLLATQPYLTSSTFAPRHPGTDNVLDLNTYRTIWTDTALRTRASIDTIAKAHCHITNTLEAFRHDTPWLTVPSPLPLPFYVVNRTSRYHNPDFDWPLIVKHFASKLLFIGHADEHLAFQRAFGPIPFLSTPNHLLLAQAISGSLGFIGNQSFPLAIALAIGKKAVVEEWPNSPDCRFVRDNILSADITNKSLASWVNNALIPTAATYCNCYSAPRSKPKPPTVPPAKSTPFYFSGHFDAAGGYGTYTLQLTTEIIKRGYDLSLCPITSNENDGPIPAAIKSRFTSKHRNNAWELVLYPCVIQPASVVIGGRNVVYMTMWESTRLHSPNPAYARAMETLNNCAVIIVPNAWNASTFSACGINTPIRIAPLGTDIDAFPLTPNNPSAPLLTFGTAGRLVGGGVRKGVDLVIDAFLRAFPAERNVRLNIKCFPGDPMPNFHDDRIQVTAQRLSIEQLRDWYASINIFVSGCACEGWGRHQQEAMCMGRPVIGINFGGVCEFFSRENGYAVPWTLEPGEGVYSGLGHYAKPTIPGIAACMQEAFEDRSGVALKGKLSADYARRFTIANSLDGIESILREFKFLV